MNAAIKKQIFDIVLKEALRDSMEKEFKKIDEMVIDEPYEFSSEFEKKMKKLIHSIGRKDRIKKFKHIAVQTIVSAAAVFGVIFGGLLTQPDVYATVKNVFRSVFEKYDTYEYNGESISIEDFNNNIRLGYIPDGYSLSNGDYSRIDVMLIYSGENDEIIFEYGIADGATYFLDNEHEVYETLSINGKNITITKV